MTTNDEKIVLSIETSTGTGSLAILAGGRLLKAEKFAPDEIVSENLLPRVRTLLQASSVGSKDLDGVVVVNGPGSLTGIRIGMSFAKGFAKGLKINCFGVGVMEALSAAADPGSTSTVCMVPAGKTEFYWSFPDREGKAEVLRGTMSEFLRDLPDDCAVTVVTTIEVGRQIPVEYSVVNVDNLAAVAGQLAALQQSPEDGARAQYFDQTQFRKAVVADDVSE